MCKKCDYESYLKLIDDMLEYDEYDFCKNTLESIKIWVEDKKHITEKQIVAINNIYGSQL